MATRKGTVQWKDGCWQARVWIPSAVSTDDGKRALVRRWYRLEGVPHEARDVAKESAAHLQAEVDRKGYVPAERDLTVNEYFKRWLTARKKKVASWKNDESYFSNHITQSIGQLPIRSVTHERLTDFVRALDQKVAVGEYGAKTAANIWACVMAMFRDACTNKDRSLVVLEVNPAIGVPRPDADENGDKQKQLLYPDEFLALVGCTDVPLDRRRLYAFALLAQARQAEIRALTWSDVDLAHMRIDITKSDDTIRGAGIKPTKSKKARDVTIDHTLAPILEAMRDECSTGRLFPRMSRADGEYGLANLFRSDLKTSSVTRTALHSPTATSLAIRFHDLRASGITWRLARGDNPLVVRQETGHADAEVQQIYVRKLRDLGGAKLFPTLPSCLLGSVPELSRCPGSSHENKTKQWAQQDLKLFRGPSEPTRTTAEGREEHARSEPTGGGSSETVPTADDLIKAAMKACVDEGRLEDLARLSSVLAGRATASATPENVVPINQRRTR